LEGEEREMKGKNKKYSGQRAKGKKKELWGIKSEIK